MFVKLEIYKLQLLNAPRSILLLILTAFVLLSTAGGIYFSSKKSPVGQVKTHEVHPTGQAAGMDSEASASGTVREEPASGTGLKESSLTSEASRPQRRPDESAVEFATRMSKLANQNAITVLENGVEGLAMSGDQQIRIATVLTRVANIGFQEEQLVAAMSEHVFRPSSEFLPKTASLNEKWQKEGDIALERIARSRLAANSNDMVGNLLLVAHALSISDYDTYLDAIDAFTLELAKVAKAASSEPDKRFACVVGLTRLSILSTSERRSASSMAPELKEALQEKTYKQFATAHLVNELERLGWPIE